MRLWSLHPKYLDSKGLVALWREALLAKHVLAGLTKGYKHHPQLQRFQKANSGTIETYLAHVHKESVVRNYNFDATKFTQTRSDKKLKVTSGQVDYEFKHLLSKLKTRDPARYKDLKHTTDILPHPVFQVVEGGVESWEVV